ncbi:hypothetical protein GCM10027402_13320 [Arthrobacter monumenti]
MLNMSQPGPDSSNGPANEQVGMPAGDEVRNAAGAQGAKPDGTHGKHTVPETAPTTKIGSGQSNTSSVSPRPADGAATKPIRTAAATGGKRDAPEKRDARGKTGADGKAAEKDDENRGDWKLFRAAVALVGLLLLGFGVFQVLLGTAGLPGPASETTPTLESNYRYFAALLVGVGAAFLTIAVKFEWANVLWFVCAMVFIGGIARVISWALSGTPHVIMIVLMVLELVVPPVLVVWHRWLVKTAELKRTYSHQQGTAQDMG